MNQGPIDLQSIALPLSYTPTLFKAAVTVFLFNIVQVSNDKLTSCQQKLIEGALGVEPRAYRSAVDCSTTELYPLVTQSSIDCHLNQQSAVVKCEVNLLLTKAN